MSAHPFDDASAAQVAAVTRAAVQIVVLMADRISEDNALEWRYKNIGWRMAQALEHTDFANITRERARALYDSAREAYDALRRELGHACPLTDSEGVSCSIDYDDMRTGLNYADVVAMMYSQGPPPWRNKNRHGVLGFWRELKQNQWEAHTRECACDDDVPPFPVPDTDEDDFPF